MSKSQAYDYHNKINHVSLSMKFQLSKGCPWVEFWSLSLPRGKLGAGAWMQMLPDTEIKTLGVLLAMWPVQPSWRYFKGNGTQTAHTSSSGILYTVPFVMIPDALLDFFDHGQVLSHHFQRNKNKAFSISWQCFLRSTSVWWLYVGFCLFLLFTLFFLYQLLISSSTFFPSLLIFYK